jgi:hypothetical protein
VASGANFHAFALPPLSGMAAVDDLHYIPFTRVFRRPPTLLTENKFTAWPEGKYESCRFFTNTATPTYNDR